MRRLDIAAEILEVTRREGSIVELRRSLEPVGRYVEDALAVAGTAELPRPPPRTWYRACAGSPSKRRAWRWCGAAG